MGLLLASIGWRRGWYAPTLRGHLSRLALTYALCVVILSIILANRDNRDFGLWGQAVARSFAAMLSPAAVDIAVTLAARKYPAAAT